ncbi:MAG TPA: CusA/CzcA family heavy metal efflux RND transporter [Burkholderiaceae bacterium]|nr:CusA/CzcA family heavy metal efflux RND transporter [Burkholderiaceae bacterium]
MVEQVIGWSLRHRVLVLLCAAAIAIAGMVGVRELALDAIPDLSEVQVIVQTSYPGQPPQTVEDQVSYPLASALLAVPTVAAVRGFSMFGESYLYLIFHDGTDPYWARSRVLEYLTQIASRLPPGVTPMLGPDASGVGWVFSYALVDRQHRYEPDRLRALQDFFLKLELQSVPGVAEVASVGGQARQFQIEADPARLAGFGLGLERVVRAVQDSNISSGGSSLEMGRAEYMVRAPGYLAGLDDFRNIPLGADARGQFLRLSDVAHVQIGAEARRGLTDLDGLGEAPGGIVVMRHGENALALVDRVKQRLQTLQRSLPPGVQIVVTYDRSELIRGAIATLERRLLEECLVVSLVCGVFLAHVRSALVIIVTLPLGILAALGVLALQGTSANLMSLGGIAIAIGAMVDAAIVMVENLHKHLERAPEGADRWPIVFRSAREVGPALFFSLLVITVSFLPVFALTGQEGRLFRPLASTKTYAMAASALLAVTLTPVLMGLFVRGRIAPEGANALHRLLRNGYQRTLIAALRHPRWATGAAALALLSAAWPLWFMGSEFMPPLYEGSILYMPSTLPSVSVDEAGRMLQVTDRLIGELPEVEQVYGKAGRAQTATDPAPLTMFETVVLLKPPDEWPAGEDVEEVMDKLDRQIQLPGITNGWGYPIRTRIDMLASGVRTPLGLKISGPDLATVFALAHRAESALRTVAGTRGAFAERVAGGRYLDIELDRQWAARYGVTAADVQQVVQGAIGGETIATVVAGRERYSVNLRYPRSWRDSPQSIAQIPFVASSGQTVHLGDVAHIALRDGATEIKSENAQLVAYVYLNLDTSDLGGYVSRANRALAPIALPPGYTMSWAGQYEQMQHARARLAWLIPATIALAAVLLFGHFRNWERVALVLLCLPFSLVGGVWLVYALGYRLSVAVAVGFLALTGVATEFGVVMLLYLDQARAQQERAGVPLGRFGHLRALIRGASTRVRPKAMTVAVIVGGLLPVMVGGGLGSDVMKRIAAPLVGGMLTAPLLSLIVLPLIYEWWQRRRSGRAME